MQGFEKRRLLFLVLVKHGGSRFLNDLMPPPNSSEVKICMQCMKRIVLLIVYHVHMSLCLCGLCVCGYVRGAVPIFCN